MICQEYKEYICVKQLNEYKQRFIDLVEHYGKELNNKIVLEGNVYTLHNFDNHCLDIYKIISDVLLDSNRAYGNGGLTEKELYILDLAVLFHDISMSSDITTERKNHSQKSAEYIQGLYDNTESLFFKECDLNSNEVKALKAIITAHSDVKDSTVDESERGLLNPVLSKPIPARTGVIRGKLLAGILRLADELDITSERLGNFHIEENLKKVQEKYKEMEMQKESGEGEVSQKKYDEYKKYVESLKHWKNLHLFSQILRESQDDVVYLVTDDEYLQSLLDSGNTAAAIVRQILKIYEKIKRELEDILHLIVENSEQKLDIKSFFPVTSINVRCGLKSILVELDKQLNNVNVVKEATILESIESDFSKTESESLEGIDGNVQIIDLDLSNKLKKEITRRHLLKVGHFLLDDIFCARDWIDTKEIVETKYISDKIIGCFIEHIKKTCNLQKQYLIVGLDLEGSLLASRLAMGLKMPFSYIIPVREKHNFSLKELEIKVNDYAGIILITDVIVAFDTIKKALQEIAKSNKMSIEQLTENILNIYSIFYRESELVNLNKIGNLRMKTFCINKDFPIELFKKEECHYIKEGECLALNNRIGRI